MKFQIRANEALLTRDPILLCAKVKRHVVGRQVKVDTQPRRANGIGVLEPDGIPLGRARGDHPADMAIAADRHRIAVDRQIIIADTGNEGSNLTGIYRGSSHIEAPAKRRNRVEIIFGWQKYWRRVANRFDRNPKVFLSVIDLAAQVI